MAETDDVVSHLVTTHTTDNTEASRRRRGKRVLDDTVGEEDVMAGVRFMDPLALPRDLRHV